MQNLEHKVNTLESNQLLLVEELKHTNTTLEKIEKAIERQNEVVADIRLLRHELISHIDNTKLLEKTYSDRLTKMESNFSRVAWVIILTVLTTILGTVIIDSPIYLNFKG